MLCGNRVRVEVSHGKSRPKGSFRRDGPSRRRRSRFVSILKNPLLSFLKIKIKF